MHHTWYLRYGHVDSANAQASCVSSTAQVLRYLPMYSYISHTRPFILGGFNVHPRFELVPLLPLHHSIPSPVTSNNTATTKLCTQVAGAHPLCIFSTYPIIRPKHNSSPVYFPHGVPPSLETRAIVGGRRHRMETE